MHVCSKTQQNSNPKHTPQHTPHPTHTQHTTTNHQPPTNHNTHEILNLHENQDDTHENPCCHFGSSHFLLEPFFPCCFCIFSLSRMDSFGDPQRVVPNDPRSQASLCSLGESRPARGPWFWQRGLVETAERLFEVNRDPRLAIPHRSRVRTW